MGVILTMSRKTRDCREVDMERQEGIIVLHSKLIGKGNEDVSGPAPIQRFTLSPFEFLVLFC